MSIRATLVLAANFLYITDPGNLDQHKTNNELNRTCAYEEP